MNNSKEFEITYINWDIDEIILELARHINEGLMEMGYEYVNQDDEAQEDVMQLIYKIFDALVP